MNDVNRVLLIGRLTRDPELKYTQSGTSLANFSIANNKSYKTSSGDKRDEVSFFDCIAWGKLGEIVNDYCHKGSRVALDGRLRQNRWEDQSGNTRSKVEIVVDNLQMIDTRSQGQDPGPPPETRPGPEPNPEGVAGGPFDDSDIPF